MIAGDFNFIMNIKLDKRGGRSDRGTSGKKEKKEWEKEFEITDAWRKQNTNEIGTTWTNGVRDEKKRVWTRIDRVLADDRILDRLTEVDIVPTKILDHNAISWSIETIIKKKKTPYDKIQTTMMTNQEFKLKVKELFEIEKYNGVEGYERFKTKCVETQ